MDLYVVYQDIKAHSFETAFLVYLILKLIEIAPIQINPWSSIVKATRNFFTGNLSEKIEKIESNQNDITTKFEQTQNIMQARFVDIDKQMTASFKDIREDMNYNNAMASRYRLIRAADELKEGREISCDHLEVLLQDDLKIYKSYCDNHPKYINHKGQKSVQILLEYESLLIRKDAEENYQKKLRRQNNLINWKIRFKNPVFIFQIVLAILTPIVAYAGITMSDITSWSKVGELLFLAIQNPYVLVLVIISVYNAITDPTTKGISDSERALTYTEVGGENNEN